MELRERLAVDPQLLVARHEVVVHDRAERVLPVGVGVAERVADRRHVERPVARAWRGELVRRLRRLRANVLERRRRGVVARRAQPEEHVPRELFAVEDGREHAPEGGVVQRSPQGVVRHRDEPVRRPLRDVETGVGVELFGLRGRGDGREIQLAVLDGGRRVQQPGLVRLEQLDLNLVEHRPREPVLLTQRVVVVGRQENLRLPHVVRDVERLHLPRPGTDEAVFDRLRARRIEVLPAVFRNDLDAEHVVPERRQRLVEEELHRPVARLADLPECRQIRQPGLLVQVVLEDRLVGEHHVLGRQRHPVVERLARSDRSDHRRFVRPDVVLVEGHRIERPRNRVARLRTEQHWRVVEKP